MLGVWFVVMRPLQGKSQTSLDRLVCKIVTYTYTNGEFYRNVTNFGPSVSRNLLPNPLTNIRKIQSLENLGRLYYEDVNTGKEKVEILNSDTEGKYWAIEYVCNEDTSGNYVEDIWVMSRWTDAQTYDLKDAYWFLYHIQPELAPMATALEYPSCIHKTFQWKKVLKMWNPRPAEIVNDRNVESARAQFWKDVQNGKESAETAERLKKDPEMFEEYLRKKIVERVEGKRLHASDYFKYYNPGGSSLSNINKGKEHQWRTSKVSSDTNRTGHDKHPPPPLPPRNINEVDLEKEPPTKGKHIPVISSFVALWKRLFFWSGMRTKRDLYETPIDANEFHDLYEKVYNEFYGGHSSDAFSDRNSPAIDRTFEYVNQPEFINRKFKNRQRYDYITNHRMRNNPYYFPNFREPGRFQRPLFQIKGSNGLLAPSYMGEMNDEKKPKFNIYAAGDSEFKAAGKKHSIQKKDLSQQVPL